MKIAFCGGGTLGHIYPALSIINKCKEIYSKCDITLICNICDKEKLRKIDTKNISNIYYLNCKGRSNKIINNIKMIYINLKEINKIKLLLKKERFDVIIGMGGYISGMVIKQAQKLKIPSIIHEQNSVIGLANKLVVKKASLFLTTFPLPSYNDNQVVVGNPRYYDAKEENSEYRSKKNLLITSGSLGSEKINEMAIEFLNSDFSKNYTTTLVTGVKYYDTVKEKLKSGTHYEVIAYSTDMLNLMKTAGIVISRSGSTTIFEILGSGCIPIFIPSPNVTANHQFFNANYITSLGIGELIKENDLTLEQLEKTILKIDNNYIDYIEQLNNYIPPKKVEEIIDYILKFRKQ